MRSLSFASADRSMGQATRLTAGYGYSSTHGFKEPSVVTADPLTLSLRFAAMGVTVPISV